MIYGQLFIQISLSYLLKAESFFIYYLFIAIIVR